MDTDMDMGMYMGMDMDMGMDMEIALHGMAVHCMLTACSLHVHSRMCTHT